VPTDNEDVTRQIEELPSPQKEIFQSLRELIGTRFPQLNERYAWSRPVYSVEGGGDVGYIVATKKDVNLGFDYGSKLPDPRGLLVGTGVNKRHVKIRSLDDLDLDYYASLLTEAVELARKK
jgi:hypothetical protein